MKTSTVLSYIFITTIIIILGINMTLSVLTTTNLFKLLFPKNDTQTNYSLENIGKCSTVKKITDVEKSTDRRIKKLYEYQEVCESFMTNKVMIFTTMPNSTTSAKSMARDMAKTLKEFQKYGITPIVVVEPENSWGLIDFEEFKTGFYNNWIEQYFLTLKSQGIKDEHMGIWVPFPEANIPSWNKNSSTPNDFGIIINHYAGTLKKVFPHAKISILLNSATYDNTDHDWAYGEYISLKPFVEKIKPGLIDSFGLQGFPWIPQQNSPSDSLVEPSQYLNYLIAIEAASTLGVKEIWFNTGTFSKKYAQDPKKTAYLTYLQRKTILDKTLEEVKKAQDRGYKISINLFSEDKSTANEQTDWSYWSDYKNTSNNKDALVLKDFIIKLKSNNIGLSIYDAYPLEQKK